MIQNFVNINKIPVLISYQLQTLVPSLFFADFSFLSIYEFPTPGFTLSSVQTICKVTGWLSQQKHPSSLLQNLSCDIIEQSRKRLVTHEQIIIVLWLYIFSLFFHMPQAP